MRILESYNVVTIVNELYRMDKSRMGVEKLIKSATMARSANG